MGSTFDVFGNGLWERAFYINMVVLLAVTAGNLGQSYWEEKAY
jgi:hypothetical protein